MHFVLILLFPQTETPLADIDQTGSGAKQATTYGKARRPCTRVLYFLWGHPSPPPSVTLV